MRFPYLTGETQIDILDSGWPQPGQKRMLLAFGAGFCAFAALI